ncbi:hypothetical protein ACN28I_10770 [Archangium gephyra]|uniref:hypothetical protein n=1 Tax=Archangium gephyra TaxID=48 RepID=UPI003B7E4D71
MDDLSIPCVVHLLQLRPGEFRRFSDELLELVDAPVHAATRGYALINLAMHCQIRGDASCALRWAESFTLRWAKENAAASGGRLFQFMLSWAQVLQGWALVRVGRRREGQDVLWSGIGLLRELGAKAYFLYSLGLLADVSLLLGQVEEGLARVNEAWGLMEETGERVLEAELHRLQGELLRVAGKEGDAMRSLLRAAVVAHRQRAHLFELRARVALARQLRDSGHPDSARRGLERLCGRFAPDLEVPEFQEARALLASLRPTPGSPPHPPRESPPGAAR